MDAFLSLQVNTGKPRETSQLLPGVPRITVSIFVVIDSEINFRIYVQGLSLLISWDSFVLNIGAWGSSLEQPLRHKEHQQQHSQAGLGVLCQTDGTQHTSQSLFLSKSMSE